MRWLVTAIVTLVIMFSHSVTLKYQWSKPYFTPHDRMYKIIEARPAYPVFMYINDEQPDMRLFQNYFDEYRMYAEFDMQGRRLWSHSWNGYNLCQPIGPQLGNAIG
jgi:hypothetical protein